MASAAAAMCHTCGLGPAALPGALPSAAVQAAPLLPRPRITSEADATLASLLAASSPDQADWLTQERSQQCLLGSLPAPGAYAAAAAAARPDPDLAWMEAELGAFQDDAEAWLLGAPLSSPALPLALPARPTAARTAALSSDSEVLPLPHLSSAQLHQIRGQQAKAQRAQQPPWQRSTFSGSPAEHGGLFGPPSEQDGSSGSPTSKRGSALPSRAATPTCSRAASAQPRQPSAPSDRLFSGLSVSTAASPPRKTATSPTHHTSSATTAGTSAAQPAKPVWSPSRHPASASATPRQRQTMPGTPTSARAPRPATATPAKHGAQPTPSARANTPLSQGSGKGQLSPSSKVSSWLQSAAFPAAGLTIKPSLAPGGSSAGMAQQSPLALASPSAGSDSAGSWRIAVPPRSGAAAGPEPTPASFVSRIPRPGAAAPAVTAPAASPSRPASGTAPAHQRSEQALKQLARRALASGGGGSSPQAPRPVHVSRPSSLRGGGAVAGRPESPAGSLPGSPTGDSKSHTTHSDSPSGAGSATPSHTPSRSRSCHRLSSSSSSPRASSPLASPQAQLAAPTGGLQHSAASFDSQLAAAQAAAAAELAAAQAGARQAAADHALLARASPRAWEAAQAAAAAAAPGASAVLDQQLAQLDALCQTLSDASSHMSEILVDDALARSRRASSSVRRLSFLSRGSLLSLGSHASSHPGSAALL